MAVTKQDKSRTLYALTSAALCLPGMDVRAATPSLLATGSTAYGYYQESDQRMQVQIYHADGLVPLTERLEFAFSLDRDTYSGASPAWNVPQTMTNQTLANGGGVADLISAASAVSAQSITGEGLEKFQTYQDALNASGGDKVKAYTTLLDSMVPAGTATVQRFQTQPLETRTQPVLSMKYYMDNSTLGISGGLSDEPDYLSNFGAINFSHEFNNKQTTLSAGYNITRNAIFRNQGHNHSPADVGLGHIHPADCTISDCTNYALLNANSVFNGLNLGVSQVLGKNTLYNLSTNYTNQSGFLSNPYKTVYVRGEITPTEYAYISDNQNNLGSINWNAITPLEIVGPELFRENRPDQRNQFSVVNGLNHYLPNLDASLHFDYRFYHDDWNINAHTFEFKWYQGLPFGITAIPSIRYYSQSQADFFAPYFLAPRADHHYSSDYRLSAFGAINGGISFAKQISKGVKLDAGIEYYSHQGDLKLGGGGSGNYADYSYYLAHAGVNIDLSAPGSLLEGEGNVLDSLFGDNPHQHHHQHQHTPLPAGVMFGHMLEQTGQIMLGYRYMYSGQEGTMLHGSDAVSDAQLAHQYIIRLPKGATAPTAQQVLGDACPGYGHITGPHKFTESGCLVKPTNMFMGMHMLDIMYAPTDWLNLMVMPQLVDMQMNMSTDLRTPYYTMNGDYTEKHNATDTASIYSQMHHSVFDLGDTFMTALIKLYDDPNHHLHIGLGGSAPTGSVSEVHNRITTAVVGSGGQVYNVNLNILQDIGMMPGSGTWDFKPSLTYTGRFDQAFWGLQLSSVNRLQNRNSSGYALGDQYQSTAWGGYKLFDWLSTSVRGVYTQQNKIRGDLYQIIASEIPTGNINQNGHMNVSTVDYAQNYGGHYWDIGIGMNIMVPRGNFAGHSLNIEWLQPVKDYVNGYQLERTGAFSATWNYMF